jgi:hypothetical protein
MFIGSTYIAKRFKVKNHECNIEKPNNLVWAKCCLYASNLRELPNFVGKCARTSIKKSNQNMTFWAHGLMNFMLDFYF